MTLRLTVSHSNSVESDSLMMSHSGDEDDNVLVHDLVLVHLDPDDVEVGKTGNDDNHL